MKHLRRKLDEDRYIKKLHDVIRGKLPGIIAHEDILTADPEDTISIKIPVLDEPYFKPIIPEEGGSGSGKGKGQGGQGGNGNGHYIELELSIDEIADLLFEYLKLPKLQPKNAGDIEEQYKVQGISKTGPLSRIHRKKTFYEIIKRNQVSSDVFRYRDFRKVENPVYKAIIYLLRDYSGSMTEEKKFMVRSASFWILKFLQKNYPQVEIKFIVHDTEAKFTDEHEFFYSSEGGGTICSSAFALVEEDLKDIPLEENNIYVFYFSDGENTDSDNPVLLEKVKTLSKIVNLLVYGEVRDDRGWSWGATYSRLYTLLKPIQSYTDNVFVYELTAVKDFLVNVFGDKNAI
jgi:hypothetical protein